ncbi:hypothetical protein GAY31_02010 [Azospirillum brasilense]|nr:hypothetical protein [Azospirillum brasilense]
MRTSNLKRLQCWLFPYCPSSSVRWVRVRSFLPPNCHIGVKRKRCYRQWRVTTASAHAFRWNSHRFSFRVR